MELVNAKCPNCKAEIQVNKDLEKTICQYCGETVSIKEALELADAKETGIKVDGVKSDSKKFEEVEKYFKLKEYANAKKTLDKIIANDEFNIEANCKWIYSIIMYYNWDENSFSDYDIMGKDMNEWKFITQIYNKYKRLAVIDEENEREQYLKEINNTLKALNECVEKYNETTEKRKKLSNELKQAFYTFSQNHKSRSGLDYIQRDLNPILQKHFDTGIGYICDFGLQGIVKDTYVLLNIASPYIDIYLHGFFLLYKRRDLAYNTDFNAKDYRNPETHWEYYEIPNMKNYEDLEQCVKNCIDELTGKKKITKDSNKDNTKKGLFKWFK